MGRARPRYSPSSSAERRIEPRPYRGQRGDPGRAAHARAGGGPGEGLGRKIPRPVCSLRQRRRHSSGICRPAHAGGKGRSARTRRDQESGAVRRTRDEAHVRARRRVARAIQIHFGDVPQASGNAVFNGGFKRFDTMLKAFPRTTFIAHADTFWANVSSDYSYETAYPTGPIRPGGLSDKWLSEYPNLYGDMSANSCNNALNRDPEFMTGFLARHQDKLIFGCDCSCSDGRGAGQTNATPRLRGKCIARETLAAVRRMSPPEVFRKIRWENGTALLGLPAAP